ncbi:hypothetical protein N656DRAFT_791870 [Canariomyces notabilis]|uniref:Uncharacterized protein n=1 Tax=Canariomyces notabilis TaxID=2074819 RepID=A0AAN6QMB9_9PEZI|nr:hypothetical protein N656DRAFT_791870 [Canariomyces arenarius]
MRYHVKNHPTQGWMYEEIDLDDVQSTARLLARIVVAKIKDEKRLIEIFRTTPVVQNDPNWRCRTWVADVLSRIAEDGKIEALARDYVAKKTEAGRYANAADLLLPKPTWNMFEEKEIVP